MAAESPDLIPASPKRKQTKRKTAAKKATAKKKAARKAPAKKPAPAQPEDPYLYKEVFGMILGGITLLFLLALVSYTPADLPSWVPFSRLSSAAHETVNFVGPVGAIIAGYAYFFFGAASFLIPAVLAWWTFQVVRGGRPFTFRNVAAFAGLIFAASCLIEFQNVFFQDWVAAYNLPKSAGGVVGFGLGHKLFEQFLGAAGSFIIVLIGYAIAMIILTGLHPLRFASLLREQSTEWWEQFKGWQEDRRSLSHAPPAASSPRTKREPKKQPAPKEEIIAEEEPEKTEQADLFANSDRKIIDASDKRSARLSPEEARQSLFPKKKEEENDSVLGAGQQYQDYELPSLDILAYADDDPDNETSHDELIDVQNTIVSTLGTFGVPVEPGDITKGPSITRYELYPSAGLRVNKITALQADLALATKAERINILAPVPGKDTVGIEIANDNRVPVALRELFEGDEFRNSKAKLPLALGKDVYGNTVVGDLAKMPHLLVAGATGSGKSVCINSIIASLLYRFTPDELRFIMVDPKVVEMQLYNDLPHMVVPVVTDPKKVLLALRWVINEMEKRYALFAKMGTRNFEGFNELRAKQIAEEAEAKAAAEAAAAEQAAAMEAASQASPGTEEKAPWEDDASGFLSGDAKKPDGTHDELEREGGFPTDGAATPTPEKPAAPTGLDAIKNAPSIDIEVGETPLPKHAKQRAASESDEHIAEAEANPHIDFSNTPDEDPLPDSLPYIVVIIDELADLMQTAPADVESGIARIAQKARAAGIHLIVATQTPRADVVTGIIKANIPSRVAFQVSCKMDSRIILDVNGAENLVGKGDMLYLPPGSATLVRSQGALITDEEAQDLVDACAAQGKPSFESDAQAAIETGSFGDDDSGEEITDADEEIIQKCLEVIQQERRASTSLLQRRLRLGYTRAARMIDILESRGIIGPGDGAKPREILIELDGEEY